jgi:hypothetical protein
MRRLSAVVVLLALVGCTEAGNGETTTAPTTTAPSTTTTMGGGPTVACDRPAEFIEGGMVVPVGDIDSDAGMIGPISWADLGTGCEEFTIVFQSAEGAPATTAPLVTARFVDSLSILRIGVDAPSSAVIDQVVGSGLVDHLYVVHSLTGQSFIDLHLTGPVRVRVSAFGTPARVVVELLPGVIPVTSRPIVGERLVVTRPLEGSSSASPVIVAGYARNFDDGVLVIATAGTETLYEQTFPLTADVTGWIEFRAILSVPSGPILVFVGEDPPGPGLLSGVVIPMTVQ